MFILFLVDFGYIGDFQDALNPNPEPIQHITKQLIHLFYRKLSECKKSASFFLSKNHLEQFFFIWTLSVKQV